MAFEPRLTAPDPNEKYWKNHRHLGGLNPYPGNTSGTSSLPNCTSYAFGRFYEILEQGGITECQLGGHGNACTWFTYNQLDDYERGTDPCEGAVICWAGGSGGEGHVAVVEVINDDGTLKISESGWGYTRAIFSVQTIRKSDSISWRCPWERSGNQYQFQGFIYNPAVSRLSHKDRFIRSAIAQVGKDITWTKECTGVASNNSWNGAFVVACGKAAGVLNIIIPNNFSCSAIGRVGVLRNMGQWLKGPAQGGYVEPELGDIVFFRNRGRKDVNTYVSDRCGIITDYNNNIITTCEGDISGFVRNQTYRSNSTAISGYFRPDWSQVDTAEGEIIGYHKVEGLYTNSISNRDAAVREICYMNTNMQPTSIDTGIHLSVLNYTGLLANMYSVFGGQLATSTDANTSDQEAFSNWSSDVVSLDNLTQNQKICFQFLYGKGLTVEQVCGIMGNISRESGFNPSAKGDYKNGVPTSFGICQWHYGRGDAMKAHCGLNWATNLTGQLEYLWIELNGSESAALSAVKLVTETGETGVWKATKAFMIKFERPSDQSDAAVDRRNTSSMAIYKSITTQA